MDLFSLLSMIPLLNGGMYSFVALVVSVTLFYIVSSIIGKPFNLNLGPLKLNFGNKKDDVFGEHKTISEKPKNDVINNAHNLEEQDNMKDVNKELIVEKVKNITAEIETQVVELGYDTIRRQVNFAEERVGEIKSIMSETYYDLLEKKLSLSGNEYRDIRSNKEYKNYQMILRLAMNECVISLLKKSFKANHLDEMNNIEWNQYIKQKSDTAIQQIGDFLDIMYGDYFLISRQELSDGNDDNIQSFQSEIKNIFENAKNIQKKNNEKIVELRKELNNRLQHIIN